MSFTSKHYVLFFFFALGHFAAVCSAAEVKECPESCSGIGNCNALSGVCECPFGFHGDACEHSAMLECPTRHVPLGQLQSTTDRAWNTATMVKSAHINLGPWPCGCLRDTFKLLNMRFGFDVLCVNTSLTKLQDALSAGELEPDSWAFITMAKPDELKGAIEVQSRGVKLPRIAPLGACGSGCNGFCVDASSADSAPIYICRCWQERAMYKHTSRACEVHLKSRKPQGCLNECSNRGTCEGLFCRCSPDWWGPDCGLTVRDGRAITLAELWHEENGQGQRENDPSVRFYVYTLPVQYRMHYTPTHSVMCTHVLRSRFRTADPAQAQFFFLTNGDDVMQRRRGMAMLRWVRDTHPWYNIFKQQGFVNHILMLTKDYGFGSSWWRPQAQLASASYEPEFNPAHPDRAIMALSFSDYRDGADAGDSTCRVCFQKGKDIQVPPLQTAADGPCHIVYDRSTMRTYSPWSTSRMVVNERKYQLFFAGHSVEYPDGKDLSGRWSLIKHHANRDGFLILSTQGNHSRNVPLPDAMTSSVFCFIPLGRTDPGYTGRYLHAVLFGCIPVFWHPKAERSRALEELPEMQWSKASLTVGPEGIATLHETLAAIPPDTIKGMQAYLEGMWRRMLWTSVFGAYLQEDKHGDAWDGVLRILQARWMNHTHARR